MKYKLTLIALLLPAFVFAQEAAEISTGARLGAESPRFAAETPKDYSAASSSIENLQAIDEDKGARASYDYLTGEMPVVGNYMACSVNCSQAYIGALGYPAFINGGGFAATSSYGPGVKIIENQAQAFKWDRAAAAQQARAKAANTAKQAAAAAATAAQEAAEAAALAAQAARRAAKTAAGYIVYGGNTAGGEIENVGNQAGGFISSGGGLW